MRRLTRHHDDSGAVTLFVVIAMPVLLLFAALTFDGARGFVAERETQNSADAAALAMAMDCSKTPAACDDVVADGTAAGYQRGSTVVPGSTGCNLGAATCTATMHQTIGFRFGAGSGDVERPATAKWGKMGSGDTVPLIISACEYSLARLDGADSFTLYMGDTAAHENCPGGAGQPPGGFGWLDQTGCSVHTSAAATFDGSNGASSHGGEACIIPLLGKEIVVPIFEGFSGSGSQATYTVVGYATIKLTGYSFNGNDYGGTLDKKCPDEHIRGKYCISGDFVRFSTQHGTAGGTSDFGTYFVGLIS